MTVKSSFSIQIAIVRSPRGSLRPYQSVRAALTQQVRPVLGYRNGRASPSTVRGQSGTRAVSPKAKGSARLGSFCPPCVVELLELELDRGPLDDITKSFGICFLVQLNVPCLLTTVFST